jgi:hypothetical protein
MFAFNVAGRDTPRSVARVHEFLNKRQMQVRNIDDVNTGLDCFYHTLRLGVSNGGRVTDTMAQLIDGQPQHEVLLHQETPARLTAEKTIRWILNSTAAGFRDQIELFHAFLDLEGREYLGPNRLNRIPANCSFQTGEATTQHCRL